MISDDQVLNDVRPTYPGDKRLVRNIDGAQRLERLLRLLPGHYRLEHVVAANAYGVLACVFSRDPSKVRPGDFDYVAPLEAEPADVVSEPAMV